MFNWSIDKLYKDWCIERQEPEMNQFMNYMKILTDKKKYLTNGLTKVTAFWLDIVKVKTNLETKIKEEKNELTKLSNGIHSYQQIFLKK